MTGRTLSKADMMQLLEHLSERLRRKNTFAKLHVVGSACIALAYQRERTTEDIDVRVEAGDYALKEAIREIAQERGLPREWLNDQVRTFRPERRRSPAPHTLRIAVARRHRGKRRVPAGDEARSEPPKGHRRRENAARAPGNRDERWRAGTALQAVSQLKKDSSSARATTKDSHPPRPSRSCAHGGDSNRTTTGCSRSRYNTPKTATRSVGKDAHAPCAHVEKTHAPGLAGGSRRRDQTIHRGRDRTRQSDLAVERVDPQQVTRKSLNEARAQRAPQARGWFGAEGLRVENGPRRPGPLDGERRWRSPPRQSVNRCANETTSSYGYKSPSNRPFPGRCQGTCRVRRSAGLNRLFNRP